MAMLFGFAETTHADTETLSKVRVFYRPDGGVSITQFVKGTCQSGELEIQCMDRVMKTIPENGLPYDDMSPSELPDRTYRDKWRGEKGKGIWIDYSLVTRNDKIREFNEKIDEELDKEELDIVKVAKLERLLEKVKKIDHPVLTTEDLAGLEPQKKSFLVSLVSAIINSIENFFSGIISNILTKK